MNLPLLSIKRPIFITCIFILLLGVGYLSLKSLAVDLFPDVTFPVVTVTTTYSGAGPQEVETLVSKPIEDELSSLSGLKTVRSFNRENVSIVIAEFYFQVDIKYAEQQVRDRVSVVRGKLPEDVKDPIIRRIDPADQPVLVVGISAELPPARLFDLADDVIRPKIQQVDHVGLVAIQGGRKREVRVELDQRKLKEHELSATVVSQRIAAAGENIPAGSVSRENSQVVYRTLAEFQSIQDISSVIVSFVANERPVRVSDVGQVVDSLEEERSRVFLTGKPALVLMVYRQSGSNTVAVVDAVKKRIAELNQQYREGPEKVQLSIVHDMSKRISANVVDVRESIMVGIALTILVVLYFLGNMRSTLITSLALPNSLLGAFILMAWAGFSINVMTLLALSLAVGLLVDDAIVVRENIFRHLEMGKSPRDAAVDGTNEVMLAVVATTLTVIAVFGPIGFLQGVVGQFFKQFGLTICFAMMISLFDAVTMAPMLSAYFAGKAAHGVAPASKARFNPWSMTVGWSLRQFDRFQRWLEGKYERVLHWTLRYPLVVIGLAIAIFITSIVSAKFIPKTFLPAQDDGEFSVRLDLPPGTSLDGTQAIAVQMDEIIRSNREVRETLLTVGDRDGQFHQGEISVTLVPASDRTVNTTAMKDRVREQLKPFASANPIVGDINHMGTRERPFTLNISGTNLEEIEGIAAKVKERLQGHPALKDVDVSFRSGKPEFQFIVDPERSERIGVSTKTAGLELRTLVDGMLPAVFREKGREYDIRVRLQNEQRNLRSRAGETYIPNINQRLVPLKAIATMADKTGPAEISRQNRMRYVRVEADVAPDGPGMGGAMAAVRELFQKDIPLPPGVTYSFVGQAESFGELIMNMLIAMVLGVLFIYLVLASLYESFITPLAIMLVLPLAICGAFFGLLVTGKSLDIFSMIGCILLLGVATKNSILLVDLTHQLMGQGMERSKALIQAGRTRLRPILMTSFALIAGMLPVAIGLNEASRPRTSMGVAIIGGLLSSTALSLVVVPAAFSYIDRFGAAVSRLMARITSARPAVSPISEGASDV